QPGELTGGVRLVRAAVEGGLQDHGVEAAVAEVDPPGVTSEERAEAVHALLAGPLGGRSHVPLAGIDADHPTPGAPGEPQGGTAVAAVDAQHARAAVQLEDLGHPVGESMVTA